MMVHVLMVQSRFFLGLMISHVYGVPRRWAHLRQTGCKLLPNRFRCSPFVKNRSQTYVPFAMTTLGALFSLHKYQVTRLNLVSRFSSREINGDRNLSNRDEKERKKERKKMRENYSNFSMRACRVAGWGGVRRFHLDASPAHSVSAFFFIFFFFFFSSLTNCPGRLTSSQSRSTVPIPRAQT